MSDENILKIMKDTEAQFLGAHTSGSFESDPKHLAFTLSRYKFVAKMLEGYSSVLEVGCGDGFGSTLVAQATGRLVATDNEAHAIENPANNKWVREKIQLAVHDMLAGPYPEKFDAIYSLDVIEHIPREKEDMFMKNLTRSSNDEGTLIIGTPNETASPYASPNSQVGHINLKTFVSLKEMAQKYYKHVFMFGMNDEVVHTGFGPMCHYIMALAVGLRSEGR